MTTIRKEQPGMRLCLIASIVLLAAADAVRGLVPNLDQLTD